MPQWAVKPQGGLPGRLPQACTSCTHAISALRVRGPEAALGPESEVKTHENVGKDREPGKASSPGGGGRGAAVKSSAYLPRVPDTLTSSRVHDAGGCEVTRDGRAAHGGVSPSCLEEEMIQLVHP